MTAITSSPTMQHVLWATAIIVAVIIVTLFLSMARPLLEGLFEDVRSRMADLRRSTLASTACLVGTHTERIVEALRHEPKAPIVSELEHLGIAVNSLGDRQVAALQSIETKVGEHVTALRSVTAPAEQSAGDRQQVVDSVSGTSILGILFLLFVTIALGIVNASLLGIFFGEVIGTESIFKYPLPNIPRGYVLAALMFVGEVACGWAIYRSAVRAQRQDTVRGAGSAFFRAVPWVGVAGLAIVEVAAYSMLSQRVDLAHRLKMDPNGPMYGLAEYFLAFMGLALTLMLAYLGHAIAESLDERRRSRVARDLLKAMRRGKDNAVHHAERLRALIATFRQAAEGLPASMPEEFQRAVGTPPEKETVLATIARLARKFTPDKSPTAASTDTVDLTAAPATAMPVRTSEQVWGDLLVSLLFLVILGSLVVLTALEIAAYLQASNLALPGAILWLAAIAVPSAIVGMALGGWSVLKGLRHASPATAVLPERRGRVIIGWLLVATLLLADVALAVLAAVDGRTVGGVVVLAILGIIQGIALCVFAGWLDEGLLATLHVAHIAVLAAVRLGAFILAAVTFVVSAFCSMLMFVVRLLAIPGDLLRGRTGPSTQIAS